MSGKLDHGQQTIKVSQDKMSWTKVTFKPDLEIFNSSYDGLNIGRTVWKRSIDIAGTLEHLKVTLSANDLNIENFAQYVDRWYPQFVLEKRLDAPKRFSFVVLYFNYRFYCLVHIDFIWRNLKGS